MTKEVCVIGAGAAGLCALRHIRDSPNLNATVFEQADHIGGIWEYSAKIGADVHSAAYEGLRINLPKVIMGYSSQFPFPSSKSLSNKPAQTQHAFDRSGDQSLGEGRSSKEEEEEPSYVGREEVKKYLHLYANHYKLWEDIQFNTKVTHVIPVSGSETSDLATNGAQIETKWHVTVQNIISGTERTLQFDSVMVCNGHYSQPLTPKIPDIENFQGIVMHSKDYRTVDPFLGKKVVILGVGTSAMDISLEIAQMASDVIISFKNPPLLYSPKLPPNVSQMRRIKCAKRNGFIFEGGENEDEEDEKFCECQVLIFCTGYSYSFPFLDDLCEVKLSHEGKVVSPLYQHLVHTKFPTLCFVGIPYLVLAFYTFDVQVRFYLKYLEGQMKLPSETVMKEMIRHDKLYRKMMDIPDDKLHQLAEIQFDYYNDLARAAGFIQDLLRDQDVVMKIGYASYERRILSPMTFKEDIFTIIDDHSYTHVLAHNNDVVE